jgi:hypothetical protein
LPRDQFDQYARYPSCRIVAWGEHARPSWDALLAMSSITDLGEA